MAVATRDAQGRTVSDQMMYNLNPSAIQSSVHLKTLNCDGTNSYVGGLNSKIVFTIPHIPGGEYWDPSMSRFRCTFRLKVPVRTDLDNNRVKNSMSPDHSIVTSDGATRFMPPQHTLTTIPASDGSVKEQNQHVDAIRFERGCESMIRRIEIKDQSGQLIESLENYNLIYALTEVCQDDPDTRQHKGSFFMEDCYQDRNCFGAYLYPPQYISELKIDKTSTDLVYRDFELCFNPISAVAGSGAKKMWPLSACNGLRIEITLEDPSGCLTYSPLYDKFGDRRCKLYDRLSEGLDNTTGVDFETNLPVNIETNQRYTYDQANLTDLKNYVDENSYQQLVIDENNTTPYNWPEDAHNQPKTHGYPYITREFDVKTKTRRLPPSITQRISYEVIDPVYQMATVIVPPAIDMQIRAQGQALSPDGRIRLQTSSWQTFSTTIKWDETYISYVIPIHVASLKSLFFTITSNDNAQNINVDRTQFIMRNLESYNFKLNGENILSSNVRVRYPFSESVSELLRAWSVGMKDQTNPTMLHLKNYGDNTNVESNIIQQPNDAIFAVDLESFSSKTNIMDSGINVRNSTIMFEANFGTPTARHQQEWGERQTIQFYALYDMYVSIDTTSGMVSYEN